MVAKIFKAMGFNYFITHLTTHLNFKKKKGEKRLLLLATVPLTVLLWNVKGIIITIHCIMQ